MSIRNLKDFLLKYDIKLYDEQYRILDALINNKQKGGGKGYNYDKLLGNNKCIIKYNIDNLLKID